MAGANMVSVVSTTAPVEDMSHKTMDMLAVVVDTMGHQDTMLLNATTLLSVIMLLNGPIMVAASLRVDSTLEEAIFTGAVSGQGHFSEWVLVFRLDMDTAHREVAVMWMSLAISIQPLAIQLADMTTAMIPTARGSRSQA